MIASLQRFARDLLALFPRGQERLWFLLLATTLLQVGYWYLGSPGPMVLGLAPQSPATALQAVGWAVVLLLITPWALLPLFGLRAAELGVRLGDLRFGLWTSLIGGALAVVAMAPTARLSTLHHTYPWPGSWPGLGLGHLVAWIAVYALYYVAFEFFFRGVLLRGLARQWGMPAALWMQAVLATLIHLGKPLPETLAALPASLVFGVLAHRSGSLLAPIVVHLSVGVSLDLWILAQQGRLQLFG